MRKRPASPPDARELALRFLARRDYACRELADKLRQRGVTADEAGSTIEALEAEGLLDDARYAELYCRQKFETGHGALRLRTDLRRRGVADHAIAAALKAYEGRWEEAALALLRRRAGDLADERERARLYRAGLRRGFSHDEVMRAIDRLRAERAV